MISHERLLEVLSYDPEIGIWTWLKPSHHLRAKAGDRAGSYTVGGYWRVSVDCNSYRSARLAWFYMTGEWPTLEIDHINRVRDDDRWCNLRSVDSIQNLRNRDFGALRGIACCGRKLQVSVCGQYLGLFDRLEEALAVRDFALWYNGAKA